MFDVSNISCIIVQILVKSELYFFLSNVFFTEKSFFESFKLVAQSCYQQGIFFYKVNASNDSSTSAINRMNNFGTRKMGKDIQNN